MRNVKTLLLAVLLVSSTALFASANTELMLSASTTEELKEAESLMISEEIGKLLVKPNFNVKQEISATVTITLNKNNELVVLSVDCKSREICGFIKNRLNYQQLPSNLTSTTKTFKVPVRITPSE